MFSFSFFFIIIISRNLIISHYWLSTWTICSFCGCESWRLVVFHYVSNWILIYHHYLDLVNRDLVNIHSFSYFYFLYLYNLTQHLEEFNGIISLSFEIDGAVPRSLNVFFYTFVLALHFLNSPFFAFSLDLPWTLCSYTKCSMLHNIRNFNTSLDVFRYSGMYYTCI